MNITNVSVFSKYHILISKWLHAIPDELPHHKPYWFAYKKLYWRKFVSIASYKMKFTSNMYTVWKNIKSMLSQIDSFRKWLWLVKKSLNKCVKILLSPSAYQLILLFDYLYIFYTFYFHLRRCKYFSYCWVLFLFSCVHITKNVLACLD